MRKKIIIKAPLLSRSGYGEQARFALRSLRSREDELDIFAFNIPWGSTGMLTEDTEEKRWIDHLIQKTQMHVNMGGSFDVSLQVTIPAEFENIAPYNVGYTAGAETNCISHEWVQQINKMHKVITTSEHTKRSIVNTTYTQKNSDTGEDAGTLEVFTPVDSVNYPVKIIEPEAIDLEIDTKFNFLVVAQWCPRKNLEATIAWFVQEFKDNPTVGLVVKTNQVKNSTMDKNFTRARMSALLESLGERKCKIYLIHGDLTEGEMTSLYTHKKIKGLITLAHGEGFGLPVFEAVYNGLPVIATNWSGYLDFLSVPMKDGKLKPKFTPVSHKLQTIQTEAVYPGVLIPESAWAFAEKNSYRKALSEFLTDYGKKKRMATALKKHVLENWADEKMYAKFINALGLDLGEEIKDDVVVFD
tara:strand:- start:4012 stop:5253 length:1242 start_codon:yes stop_codon:yes gene_type:complete